MNKGRAGRFTAHELEEIQTKVARNRDCAARLQKDRAFIQKMNTESQKLASCETVESLLKQEKKSLRDEAAEAIKQIREALGKPGESTYKDKVAKIWDIRHRAKDTQMSLKKEIEQAEIRTANARLEILGAARRDAKELASPEDYWDHSRERGLALISNHLRPINPCWSCYSLFRFDQQQDSCGINWKRQDNEHGHDKGHDIGVCAEAVAHVQSERRKNKINNN